MGEVRWRGTGGSLSATRHAHRPSSFFEHSRVRYPEFSSSPGIRRTRSLPMRSRGPARCGNEYGSATSRICQSSAFAINQFAIARVSTCGRASSIKAREIGTFVARFVVQQAQAHLQLCGVLKAL
jgi:hypothetical protein